MAELNETPSSGRTRIAFFGLRNAGKSTLANAFTGQPVSIVSEVAGTTTDPVSKAMEILPLGPCLVTDTAGLDDVGELGAERVRRTLAVLAETDVAVWVETPGDGASAARSAFERECAARAVPVLVHRRGDTAESLRARVAALRPAEAAPGLLDGLVGPGGRVICVCPIDAAAPKGRLILPQVQLLRDALDRHATCVVCQVAELPAALERETSGGGGDSFAMPLVVTDSQAFGEVARAVDRHPGKFRLTSFSVLFARQKGDLAAFLKGLDAIGRLKDGDRVLVAEGCTHHRQCGDIGTVKVPKALAKLSGRRLEFVFASGGDFPLAREGRPFALVVHCGGCMLTRRAVLSRLAIAREAGVPVVNYGMLLAAAAGVDVSRLAT